MTYRVLTGTVPILLALAAFAGCTVFDMPNVNLNSNPVNKHGTETLNGSTVKLDPNKIWVSESLLIFDGTLFTAVDVPMDTGTFTFERSISTGQDELTGSLTISSAGSNHEAGSFVAQGMYGDPFFGSFDVYYK